MRISADYIPETAVALAYLARVPVILNQLLGVMAARGDGVPAA